MKMDLNKNSVIERTVCIHVAQIRVNLWALVNTEMNIRIP
jgi:hypothetical protein